MMNSVRFWVPMELNMMNGMRLVINDILSIAPTGLYWNYFVVCRQEFHCISQPA